MEPVQGLKIRSMTERDFAGIDDVDKRITGKEWAGAASRRASSHFWGYYPPLSFVAEVDGRIIGFIIGSMGGPEYSLPVSGWVTTIGVDPDYQRRGVGKALLKAFIDVCEISRIPSRMMLPRNELFEKMLMSMGFERGTLVDYVRKPK
ncbi:MAG: GNAT family N-acetyltransferase [Dehalococcoidia bacterium]|nr:GNAT family N-acetyltransferase [Dehalococcoidia bacterium]